MVTPAIVIAAVFTLVPFLAAAFFSGKLTAQMKALPTWLQLVAPAGLSLSYVLVAWSARVFRWGWFAVYVLIPVAVSWLLYEGRRHDPGRRGNWRDYVVLFSLGLAVDLRWLEHAWPAHLAVFSKMLLLNAGIWGFLVVRQLDGVGFDLRLRRSDFGVGLRELAIYAPLAALIGLRLGFLHLHLSVAAMLKLPLTLFFTFFFIAVPEELFFRGWMQNLMERRVGRYPALFLTSVLFGLSHFNKRALHFNWRYVLLAALAGIFYGRAWRQERRVGASAITHAGVDAIWSTWLR
jgi:uncharacterized protein